MEADEFYEFAKQPDAPDTMVFQLETTNPDPEKTFSIEGINNISDQMHAYVLARTIGRFKLTGRGPKQLRVEVSVKWFNEPDELLVKGPPWYALNDTREGLTQLDGLNRIPRDRVDS